MQCEIAKRFFEMLAAVSAEQKTPVEYGDGQALYRAEISLLEKIDEYPAANVSALSARSGVTKSAVTQMSAKLTEKGLIEPYQTPGNKKERYFRLTEAGRKARSAWAESNRAAAEEMRGYLCAMDPADKRAVLQFIERMRRYLPVCGFACQCEGQGNPCHQTAEEE